LFLTNAIWTHLGISLKCDSRVNLSPLDLAELNPLPEMSIMIFREVMEKTD